jgi:hypothetical protein
MPPRQVPVRPRARAQRKHREAAAEQQGALRNDGHKRHRRPERAGDEQERADGNEHDEADGERYAGEDQEGGERDGESEEDEELGAGVCRRVELELDAAAERVRGLRRR